MNPCSLERTIASYQGSFSLCREEEDENQDDDEGDSDAASFDDEEDAQEVEGEQLSEYERFRQSNILRNDRVLKELGFKTNLPRQVAQRGGKHGKRKVCFVRLPQFFYKSFILCNLSIMCCYLCPSRASSISHMMSAQHTHIHHARAHTHTHTHTASTEYETSFLGKK